MPNPLQLSDRQRDISDRLYDHLGGVSFGVARPYDDAACDSLAPLVEEIEDLKKRQKAAIFAHAYVNAEILASVADVTGDSLHLAKEARRRPEEVFVFAAVRFMAETAKLLNPEKRVFIAAERDGCSLAESIDAAQVDRLRTEHPDALFVCYINTTAAVKARCDLCVTSSNVVELVGKVPQSKIFFLPDGLMGANLRASLKLRFPEKELLFYDGRCIVHEQFTPQEIEFWRARLPGVMVLAHPECKPEVAERADFVGSTTQIADQILKSDRQHFLALTECGLSAKLQSEKNLAGKQLVGSCTLCPYMRSNSLTGLRDLLRDLPAAQEIIFDEAMLQAARRPIDAMFALEKA